MRSFHAISLFALCASLLAAWPANADERDKGRALAAITLHKIERDRLNACHCPLSCPCEGGVCTCEAGAAKAKAMLILTRASRERCGDCMTDYSAAVHCAAKEGKPIFFWVGFDCQDDIRSQFPHAIHCHLESLNGDSTKRLVVSRDVSSGQAVRIDRAQFDAG